MAYDQPQNFGSAKEAQYYFMPITKIVRFIGQGQ